MIARNCSIKCLFLFDSRVTGLVYVGCGVCGEVLTAGVGIWLSVGGVGWWCADQEEQKILVSLFIPGFSIPCPVLRRANGRPFRSLFIGQI